MTLNDLAAVASRSRTLGAPGGIKYEITTEPNGVQEEY